MSKNSSIRLNKVLRELNINMITAVETLEKHGYTIDCRPTTKLTNAEYSILKKVHERERIRKNSKTEESKNKLEKAKKKVKRNKDTKGYFIKKKPNAEDLIPKIEKLCINQPIRKIAIIFEIPESLLLQLAKPIISNCTIDHRISPEEFQSFKPSLMVILKDYLDGLPEEKLIEKKKKKRNSKKGKSFPDTYKYKDFVRIIYTNM